MSTLTDLAVRRVLETLSAEEVVAVATGRAELELRRVGIAQPDAAQLGLYADLPVTRPERRRRRRPATPVPERDHGVEVSAAVARINTLSSPTAVEEYLQDPRFTVAVLKQIARALGPTVLSTGRSKAEVRRDIVAGTAGFRSRSAAMSGGAWT